MRFFVIEVPLYRILGALTPQKSTGKFTTFNSEHLYIKDWIIRENIKQEHSYFVDIGAGDGIDMSNMYLLAKDGWRGVSIEADELRFAQLSQTYRSLPKISLFRTFVTQSNILNILKSANIPTNFQVLSLDIDGADLYIAESLLTQFRPK